MPGPTLPPLDTSAAGKSIRVTRSAAAPNSAGRTLPTLAPEVMRRARRWAWSSFAVSALGAGVAVGAGAPAALFFAPVGLGLAVGAVVRRAGQAEPAPEEASPSHATSQEILARLPSLRETLEQLGLNPEIHADMLQSLDALPGRLQMLDTAQDRCRDALAQVQRADPADRAPLEQRVSKIEEQRVALGEALDRLVLSAARIGTDASVDSALEQALLAQARAAAATADDLK